MVSEYSSPHPINCDCGYCQLSRAEEQRIVPETSQAAMPPDRRDYFGEDAYETASDSDHDRTKKDERIRQAPYLPRIQIWARESGPYTLRVGHQWFHCDDLLINGDEYRSQARKAASTQSSRSTQPTTPSGAASASRRNPLSRGQSYQRTRPANTPAPRPTAALARQPSRDKIERPARYESQALPDPRRKQVAKKPASRPPKEVDGISPSSTIDATNGMLVPYKPPTAEHAPPAYRESKQTRPTLRPGRLSRGNSYQVPVRSKGRKAVKFAPLPS